MMKVTERRLKKRLNRWYELVRLEQRISSRGDTEREASKRRSDLSSIENHLLLVRFKYCAAALLKYPMIVFPHQIARAANSSNLKLDLDELRRMGRIMLFNLPMCTPSRAIVFIKDLLQWLQQFKTCNQRLVYFIQRVVPKMKNIRIRRSELTGFNLTDRDVKDLINGGFLVLIHESVYELTIPCAGEYSRTFLKGRSILVSALKRSSEQELLKHDLEKNRNVMKRMHLGLDLHIADIIGLELADSVETTGGQLIRYLNAD